MNFAIWPYSRNKSFNSKWSGLKGDLQNFPLSGICTFMFELFL